METVEVRAFVRKGNIKIADVARETAVDGPVPFICECGDPVCRGIALLSLSEFDQISAEPARFMVGEAHGHIPATVVTSETWSPENR